MAASNAKNDNSLTLFFNVLNAAASGNYHNYNYLVQHLFCPENLAAGIPCVGVTDHGPQFVGEAEVILLFQTLFTAFPDVAILPDLSLNPVVPAKRCYSQDQTMINIQTILTGTQHAEWFQHRITPPGQSDHYSPPLSNIEPDGTKKMHLPADAAFTFDDNGKIVQLSMYFDRYLMNSQLFTGVTPAEARIIASSVRQALHELHK